MGEREPLLRFFQAWVRVAIGEREAGTEGRTQPRNGRVLPSK